MRLIDRYTHYFGFQHYSAVDSRGLLCTSYRAAANIRAYSLTLLFRVTLLNLSEFFKGTGDILFPGYTIRVTVSTRRPQLKAVVGLLQEQCSTPHGNANPFLKMGMMTGWDLHPWIRLLRSVIVYFTARLTSHSRERLDQADLK